MRWSKKKKKEHFLPHGDNTQIRYLQKVQPNCKYNLGNNCIHVFGPHHFRQSVSKSVASVPRTFLKLVAILEYQVSIIPEIQQAFTPFPFKLLFSYLPVSNVKFGGCTCPRIFELGLFPEFSTWRTVYPMKCIRLVWHFFCNVIMKLWSWTIYIAAMGCGCGCWGF